MAINAQSSRGAPLEATCWACRPTRKPAVGHHARSDVVHRENKWRLLRYRARPRGRRAPHAGAAGALADQPALRARPAPGKSFAEFSWRGSRRLRDRLGHARRRGPVPHLRRRLRPLPRPRDARGAKLRSSRKAHLLGYCMGGTLTAIHTAVRPEHVATLAALAAPVRSTTRACSRSGPDARLRRRRHGRAVGQRALAADAVGVSAAAAHAQPLQGRRSCSTARGTTSSSTASSRSRRGATTTSRSPVSSTVGTSRSCTATTRWCKGASALGRRCA
jgi:pimeloyl-ACP methyl ester carboxylesterase